MAVPGGRGGAKRNPSKSPEGAKHRRKESCGSETKRVGGGAAAGGVKILQSLQRSGHLLFEYLMTLKIKKTDSML